MTYLVFPDTTSCPSDPYHFVIPPQSIHLLFDGAKAQIAVALRQTPQSYKNGENTNSCILQGGRVNKRP